MKVEIGQYKEINKGSLKASFSLVIYPEGQKILDCKYFVQEDKRWFSFPQKEIKFTDGRKTEYIPYVSYLNKDYLAELKVAVLDAITTVTVQRTPDAQKKSSKETGNENSLQDDPSTLW